MLEEKIQQNEDEIDLRDYLNVIWKRKKGIIAIFLIAVAVAAGISMIMPQTFEATTLVKIGQIKGSALITADEVKEVFSREALLKEIGQKLNLSPDFLLKTVAKKFSIEPIEKTLFLKIKGRDKTPEKALETTNVVSEILIERHKTIFNQAAQTLNLEIEGIIKEKEKTTKDIEQIKKEISRLEEDANKYEKEINRRGDVSSEAQGRIAESYIKLLADTKNQKETKQGQILNLEQTLVNLDQQIQQKKYEKAYQTKSTVVEVPAFPPESRIAPKRKQNVMIAGILGLFIGILWAFGAEYFKKDIR